MSNAPVQGSDGYYPRYGEYQLFHIWALSEIFMGPGTPGDGKSVPRLNDLVWDLPNAIFYTVDAIDEITYKATLRAVKFDANTNDLTEEEVLFGIGVGEQPKIKFAFLNDSVLPHTLRVDARHTVSGSMCSYARIFRGVDTSLATGTVISKMYDASGNYIGDKVPLELTKINSHTNYATYSVMGCFTTERMPDGERITVVTYNDKDNVVDRTQFLVENTDTVGTLNTDSIYITDIQLESSFMSPTIPGQINFPLNLTLDSLDLVMRIICTDRTFVVPIDGNKARVLGLDGYMSAIPNQPLRLTAVYTLSQGETAYSINGVNNNLVTKEYRLLTSNVNYSVAVRLFGYPVWVSGAAGYRMEWFLVNLARNVWFNVTDKVRFNDSHGAFDPKLYGHVQHRSVSVNLRDVSGLFVPFIHTQLVDITLLDNASKKTCWKVGLQLPNGAVFGEGVYAKKTATTGSITINGDFSVFEDWLTAYYLNTHPLRDQDQPAPTPTHFIIKAGETETEWEISNWDKTLNVLSSVTDYSTISIRFIKRQIEGDLQLSVAMAMVRPAL